MYSGAVRQVFRDNPPHSLCDGKMIEALEAFRANLKTLRGEEIVSELRRVISPEFVPFEPKQGDMKLPIKDLERIAKCDRVLILPGHKSFLFLAEGRDNLGVDVEPRGQHGSFYWVVPSLKYSSVIRLLDFVVKSERVALGKEIAQHFDSLDSIVRRGFPSHLVARVEAFLAANPNYADSVKKRNLNTKDIGDFPAVCATLGLLPTQLSAGAKISRSKGYISRLVEPGVVGRARALSNLRIYFSSTYGHLDALGKEGDKRDLALTSALRRLLPSHEGDLRKALKFGKPTAIARVCILLGITSGKIPEGHSISRAPGHLTFYMQPEVVESPVLRENIKKYCQYTFSSIDQIGRRVGEDGKILSDDALAAALRLYMQTKEGSAPELMERLKKKQPTAVAEACVRFKFMSPVRPVDTPIIYGKQLSYFLMAEIVEVDNAHANMIMALKDVFPTPETVRSVLSVSTMLGVGRGVEEIKEACQKLKIWECAPENQPSPVVGESTP